MTTISAEVAEAVRLRDAARRDGEFTVVKHPFVGTAVFAPHGVGPVAEFLQAASRHVDLIERLNNALKATQDAYVETSAALTLEQDRNEGLHARVRELEYTNELLSEQGKRNRDENDKLQEEVQERFDGERELLAQCGQLRAELERARADYDGVVIKFDSCRAALASRYKADTGNDPTPPDEYEGTWHEWLIEQSDKAALKP